MIGTVNIAKGTTDPRDEFISQIITQILIKQFQNFDKALTSKSQPNISISTKLKLKILAKPSFRILTKIQLRNLNQTSAANFRILTKPCAQSLNKSLAVCPTASNLQQTVANTILIINISNSNNLKFWVGIFTHQGHTNQVY